MQPRRLLSWLAAATLGAMVCSSLPAARAGVTTAAWMFATTFCRGLAAGLTKGEAYRVAWSDTWPMWKNEMIDPAFRQFLVLELSQQCPEWNQQTAPPQ
jgi:hypothetical protein